MFDSNDTTVICVDIQEKLCKIASENIIQNAVKLLKSAYVLDIDTIITEQYPSGLGDTILDIKNINKFKTIEKTTFSAYQTPEFREEFDKLNNKNILIFGVETHICVLQTALDLLKKNYNVYIIADCCASREEYNHKTALRFCERKGGNVLTLEIVLFELLKSSKHPYFKEIQSLVK